MTDPTADLQQQITELRNIAQLASTVLRTTANQVRDGWDTDPALMNEVAADIDDILSRHQR